MESNILKKFLKNVGESVHNLNTLVIGLSGVESGQVKKPKELDVSWNPKDVSLSARKSRTFTIQAILIFVEEAFMQYLTLLVKSPRGKNLFPDFIKKENKKEKLEYIANTLKLENDILFPFALLMINWRNKIVHINSDSELKHHQQKILLDNKAKISNNYCSLDIEKTLKNYADKTVTLKDFTTMIAITIKLARTIDSKISESINDIETLIKYINETELFRQYKKINRLKDNDTKKRKISNFLNTNINNLEPNFKDDAINYLLENNIKNVKKH